MKRLLRFLRLPSDDRKLLARSGILLWAVRVGLWLLPYEKLRHILLGKPGPTLTKDVDGASVESIVRSVQLMSRYVPVATCLTKALVTVKLLEEAGQPACLRIGVARLELGKIEAHAWVESRGKVVIGGTHVDLSRFTVLRAIEGT